MEEKNINNLTNAELERLAILAEECGEVIQIINKIIRHGYESYHPNDPNITNRMLLEKEIGDLDFAINLCTINEDIDELNLVDCSINKALNIQNYLHYNKR